MSGKSLVDQDRVEALLKRVPGKDEFVLDLLEAVNASFEKHDPGPVERCLGDWEETVESLEAPVIRGDVWEAFNILVARGVEEE